MSLESKVMEQMKAAMKEKSEGKLRALRAIKAALLLAKTAEGSGAAGITEAEEIKLLQKLAKQRKESLTIFETQNRPDLADKEKEELEVIESLLPEPLSEEDLRKGIAELVAANGIKAGEIGKLMGLAREAYGSVADGKMLSELVKKALETL